LNHTEKKLTTRDRDSSSSENIAVKKAEISSNDKGQSNQGKNDGISNKSEGKL